MHDAFFLRMTQSKCRSPCNRTCAAIRINEQCIGSKPEFLRSWRGCARNGCTGTNILDDRRESRNIGVEIIERELCRFGQFTQLLIAGSAIEIDGIEILRQKALVPFGMIPRIGPFLHIGCATWPMRSNGAKTHRGNEVIRVLKNEPSRQEIRNARTCTRIDASPNG